MNNLNQNNRRDISFFLVSPNGKSDPCDYIDLHLKQSNQLTCLSEILHIDALDNIRSQIQRNDILIILINRVSSRDKNLTFHECCHIFLGNIHKKHIVLVMLNESRKVFVKVPDFLKYSACVSVNLSKTFVPDIEHLVEVMNSFKERDLKHQMYMAAKSIFLHIEKQSKTKIDTVDFDIFSTRVTEKDIKDYDDTKKCDTSLALKMLINPKKMTMETYKLIQQVELKGKETEKKQVMDSLKDIFTNLPSWAKATAAIVFVVLVGVGTIKLSPLLTASSPTPTTAASPVEPKEISLEIYVYNHADNQPLQGADVRFLAPGGAIGDRTDSNGYLTLKVPATGDIDLELRKDGFKAEKYKLNLKTDPDRRKSFYLKKAP